MKIWSVKSTSLVESIVGNLFNLHFINNTCSYSLRQWASYIPICCISYTWKITKSWFNNQCLKKKKRQRKGRDLNWMKDFKTESRFWSFAKSLGLLSDVWRLLFTDQIIKKILMYSLIKALDRAFVSKNADKPLKRSAELFKPSAELLRV